MKKILVHISVPNKAQILDVQHTIREASSLGQFKEYEFLITTENVKINPIYDIDEKLEIIGKILFGPTLKYCEMECKKDTLQTLISTSTLFTKDGKKPQFSQWEYRCSKCGHTNYFKVKNKW